MILGLWLVRAVLPSEIDDVSSGIECNERWMDLADVYWVIPKFENVSIDEEWCEEILSRDKRLAMHGFYHTYEEFGVFRDVDYFDEGEEIFTECFGFKPTRFKPPQLAWSSENDWIKENVEVDLFWNQVFHKVYHCGDTGVFPNWLIRLF